MIESGVTQKMDKARLFSGRQGTSSNF